MKKIPRFLAAMASAMFAAIMAAFPPSLAPPDTPAVPKPGTTMNHPSPEMTIDMASLAGSPGVGPTLNKASGGTVMGYTDHSLADQIPANDNDMLGVAFAA